MRKFNLTDYSLLKFDKNNKNIFNNISLHEYNIHLKIDIFSKRKKIITTKFKLTKQNHFHCDWDFIYFKFFF